MDISLNLKYFSILSRALFYYHKFLIPIVLLLLNTLALFYINRALKNSFVKGMLKINNYYKSSYFISTFFHA